jgi:predicted Zn finger-like uncharacterized protein
MAIVVRCPSCGRQLRVPDDLLGTRVQCPSCNSTFDAVAPADGGNIQAVPAPAAAPMAPVAEADDRPWERPEEGNVRRDWEPHRANTVLTLGILGVALLPCCGFVSLALGIATWVMGGGDLAKMRERVMDPRGETTTRAGWVLGIVGTVLGALSVVAWGLYFAVVMTAAMSAVPPRPVTRPVAPPRKVAPVAPKPAPKAGQGDVL